MARKATHKAAQRHTQDSAPAVEICPQCHEFVGRNYPQCEHCREVAEEPIKSISPFYYVAQILVLPEILCAMLRPSGPGSMPVAAMSWQTAAASKKCTLLPGAAENSVYFLPACPPSLLSSKVLVE